MIITELQSINKSKIKVFIDGEFAFVLYIGEIRKYDIKIGNEISQTNYDEIVGTVLVKRAKLRAMNLLTKRPYTEAALRKKLEEGLYSEECINHAIEYVKSYGYIDDYQYAKDFVVYHMESENRQAIQLKLMRKGITKDIITKVFDEIYDSNPELSEGVERRQVLNLFQKKYKGIYPDTIEEQAKLIQFYMRKGYSSSKVLKIIKENV